MPVGDGRLERVDIDLGSPLVVHVVAIGGSAMSGIAAVLVALGHRVSGSDLAESPRIDALRAHGVIVTTGHDASNVGDEVDLVIVSSAIGDDNPEVIEARRRGIAVARRADAQRAIVATRRGIAIAGSHGKTTTTTMLTLILRAAGWDPSFLVGGDVAQLGATAAVHDGEWLVVEADESDGTFLELAPEAAIVTSIEADHLRHYGGLIELEDAFVRFVAAVPGVRVLCVDDVATARLAAVTPDAITYGFTDGADYRISDYVGARTSASFHLDHDGKHLGPFVVRIPGRHNARECRRSRGDGDGARRGGRRRAGRAPRVRRPGASLRAARRARRRHVRRRLRASAGRGRGRDRCRRARVGGAAWSRCSNLTATRAPRSCGATSPTRSSAPICSCSPTCTGSTSR